MRRYTLNYLKGILSNGKVVQFRLIEKKGGLEYVTVVGFWRLDVIKSLKRKYPEETYVVKIEKGDARYVLEEGGLILDEKKEFSKLEDLLDYLDQSGCIKKKDLLKEDGNQR